MKKYIPLICAVFLVGCSEKADTQPNPDFDVKEFQAEQLNNKIAADIAANPSDWKFIGTQGDILGNSEKGIYITLSENLIDTGYRSWLRIDDVPTQGSDAITNAVLNHPDYPKCPTIDYEDVISRF